MRPPRTTALLRTLVAPLAVAMLALPPASPALADDPLATPGADVGLANTCSHELCLAGDALDSGCDPCVTQICTLDPFCCAGCSSGNCSWDTQCLTEVGTVCEIACYVCGDANDDGKIKATDALIALKTAVGSATCPPQACDYNGDGKIKATDALAILKAAVGAPTTPLCPLGA